MTSSRLAPTLLVGIPVLLLTILVSACMGIVTLTPGTALTALIHPTAAGNEQAAAIVWSIRLPRILVAAFVGCALALVGTVMQAVFQNPLADPGITGVSSGAAVGAVAGIAFGLTGNLQWGVPVAAFAGAIIVAIILLAVLRAFPQLSMHSLILVGVSLNAIGGALISLILANAADDSLARGAMFWLAGDLNLRDWAHVVMVSVPVVAGGAYLITRASVLDTLLLGEEIAATSGISVPRNRVALLMVGAVVSGAAVAVSGVISFVGLVVPHALRLLIGAHHAQLLPLSALGGAIFVVIADTIARTVFTPAVVQTGVICALVGAPVFLALLLRRGRA